MRWEKRRPECNTIKDVVLANTGLTEKDFFDPDSEFRIDKLDEAATMIKDFIAKNKNITIVGDYDADGICASSILYLAIKALGVEPVVRLPRRFSEGYGLSEKIVDEIADGLLITVDNGITAIDAIQKAKDKGLTVLLTDHHLPLESGEIPNADIVIDPNAIDNSADFNSYCGAGIAYKLALKLIGENHKFSPKILSMAAIATVADVMPLISENRIIVKKGLEGMVKYSGRTTGLGALLKLCEMDQVITEKNIAFKIAPILNAPGRMYDDGAQMSFELLTFNSKIDVAEEKAADLITVNEERKEAKAWGLEKLHKNIDDNCLVGDYPLCIYEPGLPEGLVGIFAGSLAEEFKVPCFVFTESEDKDIIKGSGRSFGGVHLKDLLDANSDLLHKYGGHAEAAGVSVLKANFEAMKEAFAKTLPEPDTTDIDVVYYDLEVSMNQIAATIEELKAYAPFGQGNPEIVFKIKDYMLTPSYGGYYRTMGPDGQTIKFFGSEVEVIGFGMLQKYLDLREPRILNFVGMLSTNFFRGVSKSQIELLDFNDANKTVAKTSFASLLAKKAENRYK